MDKIIVDTSVWIDFLKGRLLKPIRGNLVTALDNDRVAITDIILHELLMGTKTRKQYQAIAEMFSALHTVHLPRERASDFNQFAWKVHRLGLSGKYTDLQIAYLSQLHLYPLYSFDGYFEKLARKKIIQIVSDH